jgi:hypothetical protein
VTALPEYLTTIGAILLPALAAYFFGLRQAEQQRIIEERAKVISDLFKLYVDLDDRVASLVQIYEYAEEGSKQDKYRIAAESFNALLAYHRRNSIWISRPTARYVERFIERYRDSFRPFQGVQGRPDTRQWLAAWQRFRRESPALRLALEEEFRGALGDRRARLTAWRRRSGLTSSENSGIEPPESREGGS